MNDAPEVNAPMKITSFPPESPSITSLQAGTKNPSTNTDHHDQVEEPDSQPPDESELQAGRKNLSDNNQSSKLDELASNQEDSSVMDVDSTETPVTNVQSIPQICGDDVNPSSTTNTPSALQVTENPVNHLSTGNATFAPQVTGEKRPRSIVSEPVEDEPEPTVRDKVRIVESEAGASLRSELNSVRLQYANLLQNARDSANEMSCLRARNEELETLNQQNADSAVAWGIKEQSLLETISQLNKSIGNPQISKDALKAAKEETKEVRSQFNELQIQKKTEIAKLKEQLSKTRSERDKLQINSNLLKDLAKEQKSDLENLTAIQNDQAHKQKEINQLKEEVDRKTTEIAGLQASVKELKSLASLRQKCSELERRLTEEQLSNHQLQAMDAENQEELQSRNVRIQELEQSEHLLQTSLDTKTSECDRLSQDLEKTEEELQSQNTRVHALEQSEHLSVDKCDHITRDLVKAEEELRSQNTRLQEVEQSAHQLQTSIDTKTSECDRLTQDLEKAEKELQSRIVRIQELEQSEHLLQISMGTKTSECNRLTQDMQQIESSNANLASKVAQIHTLEVQITALKDTEHELRMNLHKVTQEKDQKILDLEQSSTQREKKLDIAKKANERSNELITTLRSQITVANAAAATAKSSSDLLKDQLSAEQSQLKKAITDLDILRRSTDDDLAKRESAYQIAQEQILNLKMRLSSEENLPSPAHLQAEIDELKSELNRCADYDKLRTDVQIVQNSEASLKVRIAQLESDKGQLQERIGGDWVSKVRFDQLQSNSEKLDKTVGQLNDDLLLVRKELATALSESRQKDESLSQLQLSSAEVSQREAALKEEKNLIEKQNYTLTKQVAVLTQAGPSTSATAGALLQSEVDSLKVSLDSSKASEIELVKENSHLKAEVNRLETSLKSSESKLAEAIKEKSADHDSHQQDNPPPGGYSQSSGTSTNPPPDNSSQNSGTNTPPVTVKTIRSSRRYLNQADVQGGVTRAKESMRRKYGLGEELLQREDSSADSESDDRPPKNWSGKRPRRSHHKRADSRRRRSHERPSDSKENSRSAKSSATPSAKTKGKQPQQDENTSSGIEEFFSDNDIESDTGRTKDAYLRLGTHSERYWTAAKQKNSRNKMIRSILGEMLHVRVMEDAPDREGITESQFKLFIQDPSAHGPKIHCTRLDTRGNTTKELLDSLWNQAFIHKLTEEIKSIVKNCADPNRFGKQDWETLAHERVYSILKTVADAKPKEGESALEALERMTRKYKERLVSARNTSSRHFKWELRMRIATTMVEVFEVRARLDPEARSELEFWQWALVVTEKMGFEFQSDEEDSSEVKVDGTGRGITEPVKVVLELEFRHPYFEQFVDFIDRTLGEEATIFQRLGAPAIKRIRTNRKSTWPSPPGRPQSFYAPVFLHLLLPHQKAKLLMDERPFPLREFEGYSRE